jgi:hypothetical protein
MWPFGNIDAQGRASVVARELALAAVPNVERAAGQGAMRKIGSRRLEGVIRAWVACSDLLKSLFSRSD